LAEATEPAARDLEALLSSTRERNGYDYITRLIYNGVGIGNGFDSFGHFLRALLPLNNCVDYVIQPQIACQGIFAGSSASARAAAADRQVDRIVASLLARQAREETQGETTGATKGGATEPATQEEPVVDSDANEAVLDFLLGSDGESR
ncbi:MAG: hypothetical protein WKF62_00460, partial [Solirubrobacterales bacterium]